MQTFVLSRKDETQLSTWGELADPAGAFLSKILERGAANPAHKRIPAGTYEIARKPLWASHFDGDFKNFVPNYKGILWLPNVPGRFNIEIHTANTFRQLEGCLATGNDITQDDHKDFAIAGGTSKPAYAHVYPLISDAIDADGAQLKVIDITV